MATLEGGITRAQVGAIAGVALGIAISLTVGTSAALANGTHDVAFSASSITGDPNNFSMTGDFIVTNGTNNVVGIAPGDFIGWSPDSNSIDEFPDPISGVSTYAAADQTIPLDFGGVSLGFFDPRSGNNAINLFNNGTATNPVYEAVFESVDPVGYASSGEIINFSVAGVPEPATWAIMLVGFGGLGVAIRSRRRTIFAAA